MTDDVDALVASMRKRGVAASRVTDRGWGRLTKVTLPGGGKLGIYEPRHESPPPLAVERRRASPKRSSGARDPARARRRGTKT